PNAFDLEAGEMGAFARRLASQGLAATGGDPRELQRAWAALAFQARGLAEKLSASDAYSLLRGLSSGGVLARHGETCKALIGVLRKKGVGTLKPRKVVSIWVALDRADVTDGSEDAAAFFRSELKRALPLAARSEASEASGDARDVGEQSSDLVVPLGPRGSSDRDWHRVLALLAASSCSPEELARRQGAEV
ncbi:unnamed protein product, partial [Polarella glacialis]